MYVYIEALQTLHHMLFTHNTPSFEFVAECEYPARVGKVFFYLKRKYIWHLDIISK